MPKEMRSFPPSRPQPYDDPPYVVRTKNNDHVDFHHEHHVLITRGVEDFLFPMGEAKESLGKGNEGRWRTRAEVR